MQEDQEGKSYPWLLIKFQSSLSSMRPYFKTKPTNKTKQSPQKTKKPQLPPKNNPNGEDMYVVTQLIECFSSTHEGLALLPQHCVKEWAVVHCHIASGRKRWRAALHSL